MTYCPHFDIHEDADCYDRVPDHIRPFAEGTTVRSPGYYPEGGVGTLAGRPSYNHGYWYDVKFEDGKTVLLDKTRFVVIKGERVCDHGVNMTDECRACVPLTADAHMYDN